MNDEQPTQSLTDAELAQIREDYEGVDPYDSVPRLLAEVDRLRSALTALTRNEQAAANRSLELQEENERIRAELSGVRTALINAHEAGMSLGQDVERLQYQRDALVRKLGLDWGPDEFGDLSDVSDVAKLQDEIEDYRQNV